MRNELDTLDFVSRVDYQPAIVGGLEVTSKITGMVAFDDELYMLDQDSGEVLLASLTDKGYERDYTFRCAPGAYGEVSIGKLVKIIAWPAGFKPSAKVLAVDEAGNALYCQPDEAPIAEHLKPGGEGSWGNVLSAALDQGDVYVLDLPSNGVWIYTRGNFGEQPTLFFDQTIPALADTIDMLVTGDDLYLLQSNGKMLICVRDTLLVAPTRCNTQTYQDMRPGRQGLPLLPSTPFLQMVLISPPDPAVFLLEPKEQAIYHFSLRRLAFQRQYLPQTRLPSHDATAFAVNQGRGYIYIALGNQVFYAVLP
jgi:hypothetical protein